MRKLDDLGWVAEQTFKIGGHRFGIRTNSEPFADWLDYALADYRMKRWVDPVYSVLIGSSPPPGTRGTKDFHILYKGSSTHSKTLDFHGLIRTLLVDLESLQFPERSDAAFAAAAVVAVGERHVLVPSELVPWVAGLGGKVRHSGVALPTEMFVAIDLASGEVMPIEQKLTIPDDAFQRLEKLVPLGRRRSQLEVVSPIKVDSVMLLGSPQGMMLSPLSRAAALHNLAARTMNLRKVGADALEGLKSLVDGARCYSGNNRGPEEMLDALTLIAA